MNKIIKIATVSFLSIVPIITFAAGKDLVYIAGLITKYLNIALALIISFAIVTFVWNVFQYFFTEKTDEKAEAGLYVLYSVIGFFVILSFWGLVAVLRNTLNLDDAAPGTIQINTNITNTGINTGTTIIPPGGTGR